MHFNQSVLAEFIDTLEARDFESLPKVADRLLEDEFLLTCGTAPVNFPSEVDERVKLMKETAEALKWAKADYAWNILIPAIVGMVLEVAHGDSK